MLTTAIGSGTTPDSYEQEAVSKGQPFLVLLKKKLFSRPTIY